MDISWTTFIQIRWNMHKLCAKFHLHSQVNYGITAPIFKNSQLLNITTQRHPKLNIIQTDQDISKEWVEINLCLRKFSWNSCLPNNFFFFENSYIKFHKNVTNGLTTDLCHQQRFTVSTRCPSWTKSTLECYIFTIASQKIKYKSFLRITQAKVYICWTYLMP